jgi:peptidoglycan/LPS O-acetylase OafA/YrhL
MSNLPVHRHIIGLDVVRFISAVMVMSFHLAFLPWADSHNVISYLMPNLPRFSELASVTGLGWVGVEIFFVLSGFVIAYSAEGTSAFVFFRSRFLRLMPGVWICASLVFFVLVAGEMASFSELIRRYLKTMILFPKWPWIDAVYWSLCVETFFYAFIGSLLLANRFWQLDFFMGIIGVASALVWIIFKSFTLFPAGFCGSFPDVFEQLETSWGSQLFLLRYGCFFALGVYIWLLFFKGATLARVSVAVICFIGGYLETLWACLEMARDSGQELVSVAAAAIWAVAVVFVVTAIIMNNRAHTLIGRKVRAVQVLGLMTYPLYLVHQTIGNAVIFYLYGRGMPKLAALFCAVVVCLITSWIISTILEPVLKDRLRGTFSAIDNWLARRDRFKVLLRTTERVASISRFEVGKVSA